jgi:hypothetical protein
MHFLFSLLRIKGLYMFQALLTHPQEGYTTDTCYTELNFNPGAAN